MRYNTKHLKGEFYLFDGRDIAHVIKMQCDPVLRDEQEYLLTIGEGEVVFTEALLLENLNEQGWMIIK